MRTPWRRLCATWVTLTGTGAAASVAFGLLVFASVLASLAIPRESAGLRTGALQRVITASPRGDWTVIETAVMESPVTQTPVDVFATDMAKADASMRSQLAAAGMSIAGGPPAWSSLTTGVMRVTGAAQPAGDGPPQFEMTYRTALDRYSRIVAGRLPGGGSTGVAQAARPADRSDRVRCSCISRCAPGTVPRVERRR